MLFEKMARPEGSKHSICLASHSVNKRIPNISFSKICLGAALFRMSRRLGSRGPPLISITSSYRVLPVCITHLKAGGRRFGNQIGGVTAAWKGYYAVRAAIGQHEIVSELLGLFAEALPVRRVSHHCNSVSARPAFRESTGTGNTAVDNDTDGLSPIEPNKLAMNSLLVLAMPASTNQDTHWDPPICFRDWSVSLYGL
jgi:hypothetical protein